MKDIYEVAGLSKQALFQSNQRWSKRYLAEQKIVQICTHERKKHKNMSSRKIYKKNQAASPYGRDKFEQVAFCYGFKVRVKRSMVKTTRSIIGKGFDNLLEGQIIQGADQAWASDIFYTKLKGENWYGISICDVYTRELLALYASRTMKAEDLELAIQEALDYRRKTSFPDCIFHSDRGSQYYSDLIKEFVKRLGMKQSMCKIPQENAYAERVQGTIKIEYLQDYEMNAGSVRSVFRKIKHLYNNERPHLSLQMKTPAAFAQQMENVPEANRPPLEVFTWEHPLLTTTGLLTKEKRSKKEKVNINNI